MLQKHLWQTGLSVSKTAKIFELNFVLILQTALVKIIVLSKKAMRYAYTHKRNKMNLGIKIILILLKPSIQLKLRQLECQTHKWIS